MHGKTKKLVKLPCAFVVAVGDGDGGRASTVLLDSL